MCPTAWLNLVGAGIVAGRAAVVACWGLMSALITFIHSTNECRRPTSLLLGWHWTALSSVVMCQDGRVFGFHAPVGVDSYISGYK